MKIEKTTTSGSLNSDFSYSLEFVNDSRVRAVYINFSEDYNKVVTLTYDSNTSSSYDCLLVSQKISNGDTFTFNGALSHFQVGDKLGISVGEKSGITAYITILWEQV